jgi:hypothetical protein
LTQTDLYVPLFEKRKRDYMHNALILDHA